jgi:type I restriction enzyme S subunit
MQAEVCPTDWQEVPLNNVANDSFSSVDKKTHAGELPVRLCNYVDVYKNEYITRDLAFMHATATRPEIAQFGVRLGDVILTKDSETPDDIGIAALVDYTAPDLVCGYHLAMLRPKTNRVAPAFLAKQLRHPRLARYFGQQANGLTRYGLPKSAVQNAPMWIPREPKEGEKIAGILRQLDAAIRETEAVVAKLRLVKIGLLHDLLTRGLDENGKLRDPVRNPEQFQNTFLGRLPKAWAVISLSQHITMLTSGSRGWAAYYAKEGPLFIRIGNLTREHINLRFDDCVFVQPPTGSEGSRTQVRAGDLLISITADLGITGVIPEGFGEAYVNQHLALVRLDDKELNPRWAAQYLAAEQGRRQFAALNDAGAKAGLSLPSISELLVAKPESDEQTQIVAILDEQDATISREREVLAKLHSLKRGLAHDLLTGRVRVKMEGVA